MAVHKSQPRVITVLAFNSSTTVWVRYCMTNFTGSTFLTGYFSSLQWQLTVHRCLNGRAPPRSNYGQ